MFSIFESVIILFPKHSKSMVFFIQFTKKSCKSAKQEHVKITEDFGKIKNEDSRGLVNLYRWRSYVPRSQDILYGSIHPK